MRAATIIKQAAADGVTLTVSGTGHLKLRGNQTAVNRWVPVVHDNKPAIVAELQADDPAVTAIRRWLAVIGETHVPTIVEVLGICAADPAALVYYLKRSTEAPTDDDKADAHACGQTDCRDCANYRGPESVCGAKHCPTPKTLYRRCDDWISRRLK